MTREPIGTIKGVGGGRGEEGILSSVARRWLEQGIQNVLSPWSGDMMSNWGREVTKIFI